jgi:hypothetical protein
MFLAPVAVMAYHHCKHKAHMTRHKTRKKMKLKTMETVTDNVSKHSCKCKDKLSKTKLTLRKTAVERIIFFSSENPKYNKNRAKGTTIAVAS